MYDFHRFRSHEQQHLLMQTHSAPNVLYAPGLNFWSAMMVSPALP